METPYNFLRVGLLVSRVSGFPLTYWPLEKISSLHAAYIPAQEHLVSLKTHKAVSHFARVGYGRYVQATLSSASANMYSLVHCCMPVW